MAWNVQENEYTPYSLSWTLFVFCFWDGIWAISGTADYACKWNNTNGSGEITDKRNLRRARICMRNEEHASKLCFPIHCYNIFQLLIVFLNPVCQACFVFFLVSIIRFADSHAKSHFGFIDRSAFWKSRVCLFGFWQTVFAICTYLKHSSLIGVNFMDLIVTVCHAME